MSVGYGIIELATKQHLTKGKQMPRFLIEGNKVQTIRIFVEANDRDEALETSLDEILSGDYELVGDTDFRPHYVSEVPEIFAGTLEALENLSIIE